MSKFIGLAFLPKAMEDSINIDAGATYLKQISRSPANVRKYVGAQPASQTIVINRKSDPESRYSDRRGSVVVDGLPTRNGYVLEPKLIHNEFHEHGIESLTNGWDGSYAIAIENNLTGSVALIHDRFGQKPCYWVRRDSGYVFSTSAGALVRSGVVAGTFNNKLVARYATLNYRASFLDTKELFYGVNRLMPGEWIIFESDGTTKSGGGIALDTDDAYLLDSTETLATRYRAECSVALEHILTTAGVGQPSVDPIVALSGGIDSGSIIATLNDMKSPPPTVISMFYGHGDECERDQVGHSARRNAGRCIECWLSPEDLVADLPTVYQRFDLPISTISVYAYEKLFAMAADEGHRTVITGGSGDALQGGNYPYYLYNLADTKVLQPGRYEEELAAWITNHSTKAFPKSRAVAEEFFSKSLDLDSPGKLQPVDLTLYPGLLTPEYAEYIGDSLSPVVEPHGSWMRSYVAQEYSYEVVPPLAAAEETIAWVHDCSIISPFLAGNMVEMGWRLPNRLKIANGINKILARQAFADLMPAEIIQTTSKKGFNAPLDQWFRVELRDLLMDYLRSQAFLSRNIYKPKVLTTMVDEHMSELADHRMLLWQILNLELWMLEWNSVCDH